MRTALFSDKERKMVEHFLKTGEKMKDFRILVHRVRKSQIRISEDYERMTRLLTKIG